MRFLSGRGIIAALGIAALTVTAAGVVTDEVLQIPLSKMTGLDVSGEVGHGFNDTKARASGPLNILLMGTDTRQGQNKKLTGLGGNLSDTTILVHIYSGRASALGVSIPRDSMVQMPACRRPNGRMSKAGLHQFNQAYQFGGPGCTIKTVESLTKIHIDHFAVINFDGFINVVDAVGGVPICLVKPINAPKAKLKLRAGKQNLTGFQALGFVRAREGVGDGSDTSRIVRQQWFLSALLRKISSGAVLTDPARLLGVLNAVAGSLTVDPPLTHRSTLQDLALSMSGLSASKVKFVSTPVEPYPPNRNRLQWMPDIAARLWKSIIADKPWAAIADPAASSVKVPPSEVSVAVVNSAGVAGRARTAGTRLRRVGFKVTSVKKGMKVIAASTLRYGPKAASKVKTLEASTGLTAVLDPKLGARIVLSVGKNGVKVAKVGAKRKVTRSHPRYVKASDSSCLKI